MKEKIPEELRKEFEQAVLNADLDHWMVDNDRQFLDKIWDAVDKLFNQEVEKRIAETVAGKFIAVEIEKRIADRFPSKEKILKYFNNHFNCHADVIIGDYETTEVAMTDSAVLKMFEWLRSRLSQKTEGGGE